MEADPPDSRQHPDGSGHHAGHCQLHELDDSLTGHGVALHRHPVPYFYDHELHEFIKICIIRVISDIRVRKKQIREIRVIRCLKIIRSRKLIR